MKMPTFATVAAALALSFVASTSHAKITIYTDPAAYFAATKPVSEIVTFDGGTSTPQYVSGGEFSDNVKFSVCGHPGGQCPNTSAVWINSALEVQPDADIASGSTWLKAYIPPLVIGDFDTYEVFSKSFAMDLSGDTTGLRLLVGNQPSNFYDDSGFSLSGLTGFVGVVWDYPTGLDTFSLFKYGEEPGYEGAFRLENVYVSSPVPEPSTLLMWAAAAITLGALRRTRRPITAL